MKDTNIQWHPGFVGAINLELKKNRDDLLFEKEHNLRKRQEQGIAAAKAKGVKFGRPGAQAPEEFPKIVRDWERKRISIDEALEKCGVSESTFYRRVREYRILQKHKQN